MRTVTSLCGNVISAKIASALALRNVAFSIWLNLAFCLAQSVAVSEISTQRLARTMKQVRERIDLSHSTHLLDTMCRFVEIALRRSLQTQAG